jgi:uncharacterized protein (TIGR03382 family)
MKKFALSVGALALCAGSAFADPSAANLLIPFNSNDTSGWTQSMARNDDQSSGLIDIGFDFCFYESDRRNVYINNNGNISFDSAYGSFTSTGFPVSGFQMIAPFWADVDTRNTTNADTNLVWHRTLTSTSTGNNLFVVTWDSVGFYPSDNSLRNTFQVVLAENENEFGSGLNAAFSYGDMNWTTGSASGGSGGFGGTAATVGINNGDGVRFDQIGRFDQPGMFYGGGGSNPANSGVDYLDGRTYFFDACQGIVPAPGALAVLGMGAVLTGRRRR